MTKLVNTTAKSNTSNVGGDILYLIKAGQEAKLGPMFLNAHYESDLLALATKAHAVFAKGEKVRPVLLDFFHASPEGAKFEHRYNQLIEMGDSKTRQQTEEQAAMLGQQNGAVTLLTRACEVVRGVNLLRTIGCRVFIERVPNQKTYACSVAHDMEGDRENQKFSQSHLQNLGKVKDTKALVGLTLGDIRKATSNKEGKSNEDKGSTGTAVEPRKLPEAMQALDTTLAGADGLKGSNLENAMILYARLHNLLSAAERSKSLQQFSALEAKEIVADVKARETLANAVKKHKKTA